MGSDTSSFLVWLLRTLYQTQLALRFQLPYLLPFATMFKLLSTSTRTRGIPTDLTLVHGLLSSGHLMGSPLFSIEEVPTQGTLGVSVQVGFQFRFCTMT